MVSLKQLTKKALSVVLAVLMCISLMPLHTLADSEEEEITEASLATFDDTQEIDYTLSNELIEDAQLSEVEAEEYAAETADEAAETSEEEEPRMSDEDLGEVLDEENMDTEQSSDEPDEAPALDAASDTIIDSGICGDNARWTMTEDYVLTITGTGETYDGYPLSVRPWDPYWDKVSEIHIEEGITGIGSFAFWGLAGVSRLSLPLSLQHVSFAATDGMILTVLDYPGGEEDWLVIRIEDGNGPIWNAVPYWWNGSGIIGDLTWELKDGVMTISGSGTIPDFTSSGESPWNLYGRSGNICRIVIGDNVTGIGDYAFTETKRLTDVTMGAGVESIGAHSFARCSSLRSLTMNDGLKTVGSCAFSEDFISIYFTGDAPAFASDAFAQGGAAIYYPADNDTWAAASADAYAGQVLWASDRSPVVPDSPLDESEELVAEESSNYERWNSYNWGETIKSYMLDNGDGTWTRIEWQSNHAWWDEDQRGNYLLLETYDDTDTLMWKKTMEPELPLWGGFYAGKDYNFMIFGQSNPNHDDSVEVIRVVRYTKNWHRIDSCSLYGADTQDPMAFGVADMVQVGDVLHIASCHVMYNGHQRNMNYDIYIPTMTIFPEVYTGAEASYVSHSLNQRILVDGDDVIVADVGDAYPRGLYLYQYKEAAGSPFRAQIGGWRRELFVIPDNDEAVGFSLGGLSLSRASYIAAANSIDWNIGNVNGQRNIFVSVVGRDEYTSAAAGSSVHWITHYAEGELDEITAPYIVKVSDTRFLLLWRENYSVVKYVLLDEEGNTTSPVYSMNGSLSDCEPQVINGKVIWYVTGGEFDNNGTYQRTWNNTTPMLFSIDLSDPTKTASWSVKSGLPDPTPSPVPTPEPTPEPTAAPIDGISVDAEHFPDDIFRGYVRDYLDPDGDGVLSEEEIADVKRIDCGSKQIASLRGIEYFTALEKLYCWENRLTELDVSRNTSLNDLECGGNQLTSLDVRNNPAIVTLSCYGNLLTDLDVTKNTALQSLYCWENRLTSLDVTQNTALQLLNCSGNRLANLDVSRNNALTSLYCGDNWLKELDVSRNPALVMLDCKGNQLTSLDVSHNPALTMITCHGNQLTSLDVSRNTALEYLWCSDNRLTGLNVSACTLLADTVRDGKKTAIQEASLSWYYTEGSSAHWRLKDNDGASRRLYTLLVCDPTVTITAGDLVIPGEGTPVVDIASLNDDEAAEKLENAAAEDGYETAAAYDVTYTGDIPAEGLVITFPYPADAPENAVFVILHLVSSGEIEILTPQKTNDGLTVTVHSLLPFAVAWKDAEPPAITISNDGTTAQATGDYAGLYVRVAIVLNNGGQSGLYVTQTAINDGGLVIIPKFLVPGLTVTGVNVALVQTLDDITSSMPNVVDSDFRMLSGN